MGGLKIQGLVYLVLSHTNPPHYELPTPCIAECQAFLYSLPYSLPQRCQIAEPASYIEAIRNTEGRIPDRHRSRTQLEQSQGETSGYTTTVGYGTTGSKHYS